ncbi:LEVG family PEP-CTERM protein [Calothrix sp. PCC 6303]|uniref:LEVG family PEP-CTERM protein n=1 Tax=Calothrix sp. PCC 6303 TaxID=1170562 RepID=UPI0002A00B5C|nr:LEVG family PEP-CTERM protein [Calothrix sp. PCC 6303]AFZ00054.1 PEP motif putative anchor domain protein [Calothrix sp. PCC 6303]
MQKLNSIVKITTVATVSLGALSMSSAAHAAGFSSFDLGEEGEVALLQNNNTSVCLSNANCIQTQSFGFTVKSLAYNDTNKASLLFSDNRDTANTYKKSGVNISFFGDNGASKLDEGTNTPLGQFWLRPVALDNKGKPLEKGRLETGLFNFDFLGETVSKLVLSLHDVEYKDSTRVIKVNGVSQTLASLIAAAGPNDGLQEITLRNVKNFEIQLGQLGQNPDKDGISFNTGDGVTLQGTAVPEPGVNASLGALGLAAMFGLNRRRNSKAVKFN